MMAHEDSLFYKTLKTLWANPIVVLMLGDWRMGKTDASLLVAHLSKKWGLIDKIGSNIWTFHPDWNKGTKLSHPDVEYITDLQRLKKWLHADRSTKLFVFDEGLKHIYRRTAMSRTNIAVIELLAELSKGHGRMIICSQIGKLDSDVLNPAFTRAVFIKKSKKVMYVKSKHFQPRTFFNLPRSPIRFDPDRLAPFIDTKMSKKAELGNMGKVYEISKLRVQGWRVQDICDKFSINTEQYKRLTIKAFERFLEYEEERAKENEELGQIAESAIVT